MRQSRLSQSEEVRFLTRISRMSAGVASGGVLVPEAEVALEIVVQPVQLEGKHHEPKLQRLLVRLLPAGIEVQEGVHGVLEEVLLLVGFEVLQKPLEQIGRA